MIRKLQQSRNWEALGRGSFTVEGAVIYPMFFLLILLVVQFAVSLYQEVKKEYEPAMIEDLWEVQEFYNYNLIPGRNEEEKYIIQ